MYIVHVRGCSLLITYCCSLLIRYFHDYLFYDLFIRRKYKSRMTPLLNVVTSQSKGIPISFQASGWLYSTSTENMTWTKKYIFVRKKLWFWSFYFRWYILSEKIKLLKLWVALVYFLSIGFNEQIKSCATHLLGSRQRQARLSLSYNRKRHLRWM